MSRTADTRYPAAPPRRQQVRAAVFTSLLGHAVAIISNLAAVPLFLRAFGQELYGFWGAILALTSYLSLLNLGIAQTVSSRASVLSAQDQADEAGRVVWYGIRKFAQAVLVAAVPICIGAWLLPWDRLFAIRETPSKELALAAVLVASTFLLQLPLGVPRAALTGTGGVAADRLIGIVGALARLGVAWLAAEFSLSLSTTIAALFAVNVLGALASSAALVRRIPSVWSRESLRIPRDLSGFRSSSAHYLLLQVAGALVWSSDAFLAGVLLDARAAAPIAVAWRVASAALPLAQLLGPAISPSLVQSWAQQRFSEADDLATAASQVAIGATLATTVSLLFAAGPVFAVWVGEHMYVGHAAWTAYCALVTLQAFLAIPDAFVTLSGRHHVYARWTVVEAVLKIVLTILLVPVFGLAGFPLATLLGRLPVAYVLVRETAHAFRSPVGRWVGRQVRPSLIASPCFVLGGMLLAGPWFHTQRAMLTVVLLAGAGFALVFWRFGLSAQLRKRLVTAITARA